jgi:hypothetical protein
MICMQHQVSGCVSIDDMMCFLRIHQVLLPRKKPKKRESDESGASNYVVICMQHQGIGCVSTVGCRFLALDNLVLYTLVVPE